MDVSRETLKDITICKIAGDININNAAQLRKLFEEIYKEGARKVVIDLSSLNYVDSSGLASFIEFLQRLTQAKGILRLSGLSDKIANIFEVTKLNTIFQVFENVERAKEGI